MELLTLLWVFFKIGIISFGGGWSIVGLIKSEVVPRWIGEADFRGLLAIAQSTPGPIALNSATLVGWNRFGIVGALLATLSVIAFPILAIGGASLLGKKLKLEGDSLQESLRTGTLAMMIMTLWVLIPRQGVDLFIVLFAVASFCLVAFTKRSPLWAIFGAGAINVILRYLIPRG